MSTLTYYIGYTVVSTALIAYTVESALRSSFDFNTFLIEMTDGSNLVALINFIVFLFITVGKLLQVVLFGELRIIETEHLIEKLPIFSINLFFNLAINDNNLLLTIILLGLAISFKIFHIILMDRLDFMNMKIANAAPASKYTMSLKYFGSFNFWLNLVFIILDFSISKFLVYDVFQGINSVTCLLFGFQFAVQGVEALTYWAKLLLNIYELLAYKAVENDEAEGAEALDFSGLAQSDDEDNDERVWENKPYYFKGIDIASASLKAVSYLCFIYLLTFHSGLSLPLSMLQGTYSSLKQAYTEITQLVAFIESSKRLDSQLASATVEDLADSDLCIVCRDTMHPAEEYETVFGKSMSSRKCPKKLACNHILHMGCLKEWLERSDSCPLCRRKVFEPPAPQHQPPTNTSPPFNHPAEELERRLEVFNTLLSRNAPENAQAEEPEEPHTATPPEFTTVNPVTPRNGTYQTIRLPSSATLPPNWIILPIENSSQPTDPDGSGATYNVSFSSHHQGTLEVKRKQPNRELNLIRPS